eukprot:Gregarina_sp_Poly_1__2417@NODE_164_length_12220_cov_166_864807_g146_i0_p11_GENE_NODE_164_length_12220_cov_166_864807_g146_i0NODE_164_length_12220_cov_166_864807_g146_i0_p11_ORF_typecomplete_len113_score18_78_NODE_164_length_12220_cov_166_864807_g146_i088559193
MRFHFQEEIRKFRRLTNSTSPAEAPVFPEETSEKGEQARSLSFSRDWNPAGSEGVERGFTKFATFFFTRHFQLTESSASLQSFCPQGIRLMIPKTRNQESGQSHESILFTLF